MKRKGCLLTPPSKRVALEGLTNRTFQSKSNGGSKSHLANTSAVGVKWYPCTQDGCDSKFNSNGALKQHLSYAHDTEVKWHPCTQDGCDYRCKSNGSLRRHLAQVNDIDVMWYPCTPLSGPVTMLLGSGSYCVYY